MPRLCSRLANPSPFLRQQLPSPNMGSQQCNQPAQAPTPKIYLGIPFVTFISTVYLTISTIVAVIHAPRDLAAVFSNVGMYASVILLYWCIYVYERLPVGSPKREKLKIPIWGILTGIQFLFVYKFSAFMPLAWRVFALIMVASSTLLGFYFFIFREIAADGDNKASSNEVSPGEDV